MVVPVTGDTAPVNKVTRRGALSANSQERHHKAPAVGVSVTTRAAMS